MKNDAQIERANSKAGRFNRRNRRASVEAPPKGGAARSHHEEEALGKTRDSRAIMRLLHYMLPYRWQTLAAFALTIASASLVLVGPLLTKVAVDLFFAPDAARPAQGLTLFVKTSMERLGFGGGAYRGIFFIALIFLTANFATLFMQYTQDALLRLTGQKIIFDLRQQIFGHMHRLPVKFFDGNPVGRLITRLTSDVDALNELFASGVIGVLSNLALLVFIIGWMLLINWRLSLVTFSILPLLTALAIWIRIFSRKVFRDTRVYIARINAFLQEHLMGMSVVHLFSREEQEMEKFRQLNEANRDANIRTVFYAAIFSPAVELIGATGIALIIWYGGGQVLSGVATLGTLIAFIQLSKSFYDPISSISEKFSTLQDALAAAERIFKLLDEPAAQTTPEHPVSIGRASGRIEFRHVWFAYQDEDWVLKDVSFVIEPGERVGVVGHTGAGKTTITNLLLKLYEPQRGQILLDGVDIRRIDDAELRSNFGVVLQDVFLFSGDIASNIRFGNSAITDKKMREAVREVNADFINQLPEGFASQIGERGGGLSVGQKQLISFARALASDPSILILDEATSSIDTATEELIHLAIERLMVNRTSLVIAHRLSTIQKVDKIIVLHKGVVSEMGRHQELLAGRGLYWRLYRLQFEHDQGEALVGAVGG
ncbi:MAG: ABC transporter ATP-binding protein [Pyrinomonadaceae bacterium]